MQHEENNIIQKDDYHGKKVFIGVGHGGSDPGATFAGLIEKNINLIMALACESELLRHGVRVRLSRGTDENDPVSQEVSECNIFNPDIAIDIHNNAGGGDGFEAYYYPGNNKGLKLAQKLEKEIKAIGQNSRGLKSSSTLQFLKSTNCTSVLVEGFFLDNAKDRSLVNTAKKQQEFGKAYAKGILKYLGIPYVAPTCSTQTKVYRVQVGAFKNKSSADNLAKELASKGYSAFIVD